MGSRLKIAIVGRPNVGKSALFNRICEQRLAIVDEAEGVTRDRLYARAEVFGRQIEMIDTGGIDLRSGIPFQEEIRRQAEIAIEEANALIMVVDGTAGITALDAEVARILLRTAKPLVLAVNKIDSYRQSDLLHQFHGLGISRMVAVSAIHGWQIGELLEEALKDLSDLPQEPENGEIIRLAIVGRPNVGKSTLLNTLLGEERSVVSPIAGTTRDSIDVPIMLGKTPFLMIDTAGIRRKSSEGAAVEKFAAIRTQEAISRSDICLLVVDAREGFTAQEKRIAQQIEEQGKGCILLFNKWDLVKGVRMEHVLQALRMELPFLQHCPVLFISAQTGRNLELLLPLAKEVHSQLHQRITTGQLNKFVEKALQKYHPPMIQGRRLRIYYLAQVDICPPRFVLFVNMPDLMQESYKQYLVNSFREQYQFTGAPIVFSLKGKAP